MQFACVHFTCLEHMQVICTKVRDGDKRIVQIKEGNPKGRHVVIVDDLVQSGGTLIECHSVLAKAGAKHGGCCSCGACPTAEVVQFRVTCTSDMCAWARVCWMGSPPQNQTDPLNTSPQHSPVPSVKVPGKHSLWAQKRLGKRAPSDERVIPPRWQWWVLVGGQHAGGMCTAYLYLCLQHSIKVLEMSCKS